MIRPSTIWCLLILFGAAPATAAEPASDFAPTSDYDVRDIEGWRVYVHKPLARDDSELGRRALLLLRLQLRQIAILVPPQPLADLRKIAIWLDDDPRNQIHYHPARQWLVDNGLNPDRAKCVDIGRADQFVNVYREQPFVVLHELAHGYHDQFVSFGDKRVIAGYKHAVKAKAYESVLKIQERRGKHYALTNHKEYFAETTESFFGTNDFYPFVRAELKEFDPVTFQLMREIWLGAVAPPSKAERKRLQLASFYEKYTASAGVPVVSSKKVHDTALQEASYLINRMLHGRDDLRAAMVKGKARFVVMGVDEFTTDVPEHAGLTPKDFWDRRARGLGGSPRRPVTSCGEENLLSLQGDPYHEESIMVHEFAHTIHHVGLAAVDSTFDERLKVAFEAAMKAELWKDKYAATNRAEYWAEGVQSYFDTNRKPDHDHNHVDTRDELKQYDGRLFALVDEVFRGNSWRYTRPSERAELPHLRGWDAATGAKFAWPKRLKKQRIKR
ncbi:MAG: hypothetical protein QGG36_19455 [Pirellulaceae bacterium]|jgi:hypothetical protein|nr:hypothetical protein [Pirellulaceae bacterium]MDP7017990.1 hypothetical protein [Pirellulaceae bacterium]